MKDGVYCSEKEAAAIMGMSVEQFTVQRDRDFRAPAAFTGEYGERFFVRGLVENYAAAIRLR